MHERGVSDDLEQGDKNIGDQNQCDGHCSAGKFDVGLEGMTSSGIDSQETPKSPRKLWHDVRRAADRTKDLFRRLKSSDVIIPPGGYDEKWSVHTWSTWVRRPSKEESTLEEVIGRDLLSDFQKQKFEWFFNNVFDQDKDRVFSAHDLEILNKRICHYRDWTPVSEEYIGLKDIHEVMFQDVIERVSSIAETKVEAITLDQWLDMWGIMLKNCNRIQDLPIWVQHVPKIFFRVINRTGDGIIRPTELKAFYLHLLGLPAEQVDCLLEPAYIELTGDGEAHFTFHSYWIAFSNFIFCKHQFGPGKFIFGCSQEYCKVKDSFPIDPHTTDESEARRKIKTPLDLLESVKKVRISNHRASSPNMMSDV